MMPTSQFLLLSCVIQAHYLAQVALITPRGVETLNLSFYPQGQQMPELDRKTLKEIITFSLIGISNVAVYLLLVSFFIYLTQLNLSIVNGLAYLFSAVYSFCLNSIFTFKQAFNIMRLVKFLTASLFLSLCASVITSIILFLGFQYWISVMVVIFGLPPLSFFIHKYWSFKG